MIPVIITLGVQWATLQSYPFVHAHIDTGGLQNGELAGACAYTHAPMDKHVYTHRDNME